MLHTDDEGIIARNRGWDMVRGNREVDLPRFWSKVRFEVRGLYMAILFRIKYLAIATRKR